MKLEGGLALTVVDQLNATILVVNLSRGLLKTITAYKASFLYLNLTNISIITQVIITNTAW